MNQLKNFKIILNNFYNTKMNSNSEIDGIITNLIETISDDYGKPKYLHKNEICLTLKYMSCDLFKLTDAYHFN